MSASKSRKPLTPKNKERRAKIDQLVEKLRIEASLLDGREKRAESAKLASRKYIVGGWVLENEPALVERIKLTLVRPQDLKAFGLPLLSETTAPELAKPKQGALAQEYADLMSSEQVKTKKSPFPSLVSKK